MDGLALLIQLYSLVVLVSVIGSWVKVQNPVFEFADRMVEPALVPLRRLIPPVGGLDISPMLLLIALHLLGRMFAG